MGKEPDEIRREIDETRARMGDTVEAIGYKADVKSRAKESVGNAGRSVAGSLRNARERVSSAIVGTKESGMETMGSASSSVSDRMSSASGAIAERTPSREDLRRTARRGVGMAQENPLGLAIGSFAVGFLAGILLPTSRVEEERLGPIATQLRDSAMETGQEALERGRQVAQETAGAAREAAQDAAQRVSETARESSQQQGQELSSSAQERAQQLRQ